MHELVVTTQSKEELIDITPLVRRVVEGQEVASGACVVFSPHTTAGITINEHADPAVAEDLQSALSHLVPEDVSWRHLEGNSPAHVKASLIGSSAFVGVENGKLALGTWQGIFLCEFDGPRTRKVWIKTLS
ncbi:MAG: secondary thiamine-phosphate synthase enzyme YjbQ [Candidatus Bipolaricaulia bacterium]